MEIKEKNDADFGDENKPLIPKSLPKKPNSTLSFTFIIVLCGLFLTSLLMFSGTHQSSMFNKLFTIFDSTQSIDSEQIVVDEVNVPHAIPINSTYINFFQNSGPNPPQSSVAEVLHTSTAQFNNDKVSLITLILLNTKMLCIRSLKSVHRI